VGEGGPDEDRRGSLLVVRAERERKNAEGHVHVAEERRVGPHQSPALHGPRRYNIPLVRPRLVQYEAPGWGVGELWLEGERVVWSELPRPPATRPEPAAAVAAHRAQSAERTEPARPRPLAVPDHALAGRLAASFAGEPDDFADVHLLLGDGFYGDCARALRAVARGEVVTYGELAALAGHPGAARAAGTFCARNHLPPFLPCHRVVSAGGIGSFGSLGVDYKRRMLALEDVAL
jgi:methylated-DNA-[protein]-cysteine S-methyltransferase